MMIKTKDIISMNKKVITEMMKEMKILKEKVLKVKFNLMNNNHML
jgi:hypothetical protein